MSNRPQVSVFVGISLDGYLAGEGGDLSWLSAFQTHPPEDTGYDDLMARADVLVQGRNTYDTVRTFETWPYTGKRVIVLTRRPLLPQYGETIHEGPLPALLKTLQAEGCRHVYLDGGVVVREALNADVVDTLVLNWVPVVLGKGIPLFREGVRASHWVTHSMRHFSNGIIQGTFVRNTADKAP